MKFQRQFCIAYTSDLHRHCVEMTLDLKGEIDVDMSLLNHRRFQ